MNTPEIKIYVANLAQYNQGILKGDWLTLPMQEDELQAKINKVLGTDEGYAIHDYSASFHIGEYTSVFELNNIAEIIKDDNSMAQFCHLINEGYSIEQALEKYEDVIYYADMTLRDVAEELVEEGHYGEIPEKLQYFIDYDAIAQSLDNEGYAETSKGVFFYNT